jgi:Ureidoglycolate lyase
LENKLLSDTLVNVSPNHHHTQLESNSMTKIDYLNPDIPKNLTWHQIPVVDATPSSLEGYGYLIHDKDEVDVEIVRWPAQGWRPVDEDSGNEGGTTEGTFTSSWQGDVLFGSNAAVGGEYVLGYGVDPAGAQTNHQDNPQRILLWHANYHPDGGQLFFPMDKSESFLIPLALPGDDIRPEHFVCFRFQSHQGCYIHPNIWHEGVFATRGTQRFYDRQGKVHARVSVNFAQEFGCLLEMPL